MTDGAPRLQVRGLSKVFPLRSGLLRRARGLVHAVDEVSFELEAGETLAIVGESGCGKSTLARVLVRLYEPTTGQVRLRGRDFLALRARELKAARAEIQLIFQDPYASLNPRMRVGRTLEEPLLLHGVGSAQRRRARVLELLEQVGLGHDTVESYPHELSGGQRQRVAIARAIALQPQVIVCDEPVSALDVSIQSQVLNLLRDLQDRLRLSYLFISHDLSVVRSIAHRVAVMYLGRVVELAPADALYMQPRHPYTRALLQSVPLADPRLRRPHGELLEPDPPSPAQRPSGCHFHPRCPHAREICRVQLPMLVPLRTQPAQQVACHLAHSGDLPPAERLRG